MDPETKLTLRTGNRMPVIGLGTWALTEHTAKLVASALDLGFRLIDTSGDYGTQPGVGEGIRISGFDRSRIYLTTKVESNDDTYLATLQDLKEMELKYADLMLIHWPPNSGYGLELWQGLIRAKADGLAKDIGVSNYSIDQLQALIDKTGEVPAVNQIEWTPFGHSKEMLGYCQENGIIIQAYSPLTRGEKLDNGTLIKIADKYDKTTSQLLIRWNIQHGTVPIIKAGNPDHLKENIDVFDFEISEKDMAELDNLNEEYSSLGHLAYLTK